jgi:hypothetical protein
LICFTSVCILLASATPGNAIDYPWCATGGSLGGLQCNYTTRQQCQAAISGAGGSCMQNPAMGQQASQSQPPRAEARRPRPPPGTKIYRSPGKHGWHYE